MLWIVQIAITRPYTFVVVALLVLIAGPLVAFNTPTDIFPNIRIPVVAVAWQYNGLPPDQMAERITSVFERGVTTTVNDVEHIESKSTTGFGVVKIFFQPGVNIAVANAQVTAISQLMVKNMPAGITPPMIINYTASFVPVLQLALSGKGLTEQQLADLGQNILRPQLVSVAGAAIPYPYGGKTRQIQIDLDTDALQARGLSAQDVANTLATQNLIIPAGTEKVGKFEYTVELKNAPDDFRDLSELPIRAVSGTTVRIGDVAHVRDGSPPQVNIVHVNGARSVLLTVFKTGSASTLAVVAGVKERVEAARAILPDNLAVAALGDQSLFVRAAVSNVVREGVIAALLTSLMILLFLGSWRSTAIIVVSIPIAILGSIIALSALGETLNIMTLGGLALAVGVLVDEATVTIESVNWNLEQGKDIDTALMDGARQIMTPAFVSLLCICIVFIPMFFLPGITGFLFRPMAEAVIFAMTCSFLLSRTLVFTLAKYLLHGPATARRSSGGGWGTLQAAGRSPKVMQRAFTEGFARVRESYRGRLAAILERRGRFVLGFLGFLSLSLLPFPFLGWNLFPDVDAGQILMHVRAPVGTRAEETAALFSSVERRIENIVPSSDLAAVVDNIGLPANNSINVTYNNTGSTGPWDGDIQISLKPGSRSTAGYVRSMREDLPREFPGSVFSFPPPDIVNQILNFGSPAPIDLQFRGPNLAADFDYANRLLAQIRRVPGVVDARIQESRVSPTFRIDVDRNQAQLSGITEADVTNDLALNLTGSSQVAPTFWLNPANGVTYPIVLQTPQYQLASLSALNNLSVRAGDGRMSILGGLSRISRESSDAVVDHYNVLPMVQIYAGAQGRDLASVARDVEGIIDTNSAGKPKGVTVALAGQARTMNDALNGLLLGVAGAIALIYFVLVVNFQSWSDPLVIIGALPAALAGIIWTLFVTRTTLSVPALTGTIMCMGVATANSILVVSFCHDRVAEHGDVLRAAMEAGFVRFRPVLMTALAMIIGMAPIALGLGEGGEQNAPLGRAVMGGLTFATFATLFFVPAMFLLIHAGRDGAAQPAGEIDHAT